MLVLVGLLVQIFDTEGPVYCNPTAVFFCLVSATFILCGLLHPQEIIALFNGFTYYLAIPTMYMILMIYAMCNLNNVSWGTREVKQTPTEQEAAEDKTKKEELQKLEEQKNAGGYVKALYEFFGIGAKKSDKGASGCCQRQCSCCCDHKDLNSAADKVIHIKLVEELGSLKSIVKHNAKLAKKTARRQEALFRETVDVITGKREGVSDELAKLIDSSDSSEGESDETAPERTKDKQADNEG